MKRQYACLKNEKFLVKVKYIGEYSSPLSLITGKIYTCLGKEHDRFRVIDETDEDYLYPIEMFEIISEQ